MYKIVYCTDLYKILEIFERYENYENYMKIRIVKKYRLFVSLMCYCHDSKFRINIHIYFQSRYILIYNDFKSMLVRNENFSFTQPLLAGLIARNISSETEIETGGKENHSRTFP